MRINWVIASGYQIDPALDLKTLKDIGPIWGSWKTWRACGTDNVICNDFSKARDLIQRDFQTCCNFYVLKSMFADLGRPNGVNLYDGSFTQQTLEIEDIISMHLSSANSDLTLLLGFDLSKPPKITDKFEQHKLLNRHGLIRSMISNTPEIQWVAIDHDEEFDKNYQNIPNLTRDKMQSVLQLLAN